VRPRRMFTALLLPLLVVLASVATAAPASALDTPPKPVGVGADRLVAVASWSDNRPTGKIGRPYMLSLWDETPGDCGSSNVTSVWVRRIQAGTETVLASGYLNSWGPCTGNYKWFLEDGSASDVIHRVSGNWEPSANLWSGPGGSPSPTNKQELRVYLFNSSGTQIGVIGLPYPG
jgi:hypothetical protein